ncbi:Scarecrow-like transcription factor [Quillaja saponaria]|uniref:Scarecrow-like transcription factor n=1 Tax=Quillaja saponaria TaxID=32244 RepID=A0AAD7LMH5_QUISA|nr:Scarecrow-like transcription factor [Quillaja saponaria]KAJ7960875.1 Scarecrow-like transcription factor [Quillaja saponaria]
MELPRKQMSYGSEGLYSEPLQNLESYFPPPLENLDHQSCSDESIKATYLSVQSFDDEYRTLESSSASNVYPVHNSPSTLSLSPNRSSESQPESQSYALRQHHSPDYTNGSLDGESCLTHNVHDLRHKIRELEITMMGPDLDIIDLYDTEIQGRSNQILSEAEKWNQTIEMISRGDLKEMLCTCAKALADNDMDTAEWLMSELRQMVSVSGEPIKRLGAYMLEGLVARLASSGSSIYKALRCKEPASADFLSYMHKLYEICPYFKFGYMAANGAIAETMKGESRVHIIDFQITQGSQWVTLIQALAGRPGGPPKIRITGVDDSTSAFTRGGGLNIVGQRLSRLAELYKVPFEFHAARVTASQVELKDLGLRPGEPIAVNFATMLHHVPDESVGNQNHRDRLLRLVKSLSPKVVTLVEQECDTNTAPFFPRFVETLNYYMAVFESIDVALPREDRERINVEQHCLAREIINLIACEGAERVERHELLKKWRSRFAMAGFTPYPLSSFVNDTIKKLLDNYCKKYSLEEQDGSLYLGWMNRPLVASCAWR